MADQIDPRLPQRFVLTDASSNILTVANGFPAFIGAAAPSSPFTALQFACPTPTTAVIARPTRTSFKIISSGTMAVGLPTVSATQGFYILPNTTFTGTSVNLIQAAAVASCSYWLYDEFN